MSTRHAFGTVWRPAVGVVFLSFFAAVLFFVGQHQADAAGQWAPYAASQGSERPGKDSCVSDDQDSSRSQCSAGLKGQERYRARAEEQFLSAALARDPIGSLGIAAGFVASLPGMLAVCLFAIVHVCSEWSLGTVRVTTGRLARPASFVLIRSCTVFSLGVLLVLSCWIGLLISSVVFKSVYEVPPIVSGFGAAAYSAEMVARATLVLGTFVAFSVLLSVVIRDALGVLWSLIAVLLLSCMLAWFPSGVDFSPGYWVSSWMRFDEVGYLSEYLWLPGYPLRELDPNFELKPSLGLISLSVWLGGSCIGMLGWIHRIDR